MGIIEIAKIMKGNKSLDIIAKEVKCPGNWLNFEIITYRDFCGNINYWESISRANNVGAVIVIAKMVHPSEGIVIVRQFRLPIGNYIMEFPGGLVDENETIETAAIRELKEETGYTGKVIRIIPEIHSSPGITSESVALAFLEIDNLLPENRNPIAARDASEDIEVFTIERCNLESFLEKRSEAGDNIDAKLMSFSVGVSFLS